MREDEADVTLNFGPDGIDAEISDHIAVPGSVTSNIVTLAAGGEDFFVELHLHDLDWPFMPPAVRAGMPKGAMRSFLVRASLIQEIGQNVTELEDERRARRQQG